MRYPAPSDTRNPGACWVSERSWNVLYGLPRAAVRWLIWTGEIYPFVFSLNIL